MRKLPATLTFSVLLPFLASLAFCVVVPFAPAAYADTSFDPQALATAQASGKPVLVEVFADWCSTCAQQKTVLGALLGQPSYKDYRVLTVDFDKQKDALKLLGVRDRSTLIVYRGKEEKGRSIWETDRERIAALLNKAL